LLQPAVIMASPVASHYVHRSAFMAIVEKFCKHWK